MKTSKARQTPMTVIPCSFDSIEHTERNMLNMRLVLLSPASEWEKRARNSTLYNCLYSVYSVNISNKYSNYCSYTMKYNYSTLSYTFCIIIKTKLMKFINTLMMPITCWKLTQNTVTSHWFTLYIIVTPGNSLIACHKYVPYSIGRSVPSHHCSGQHYHVCMSLQRDPYIMHSRFALVGASTQ